jgi:hypothetical protein
VAVFALTIHYNNQGPFVATSPTRAELFFELSTTDAGWLKLVVHVGPIDDPLEYVLERVGPGDRLRFQYDILSEPLEASIEQLPSAAREDGTLCLGAGKRIGLDVIEAPAPWDEDLRGERLSHPEGGGFQLVLGTIPRDHARVFLMAGNEKERWNWQLPDLHSGNALAIEVVETTWCSDFYDASPRDPNDDRLALEMLFRTSELGALHAVTHRLNFASEAVAVTAVEALNASGFKVDGPWGSDEHWFMHVSHRIVPTEASLRAARALLSSLCPTGEHAGWRGMLVRSDTNRLGTELEVVAEHDLTPLLDAIRQSVTVIRESLDYGRYTLRVGLVPDEADLDDAVRRYVQLIESLSPALRALWDDSIDRCFNTGIQAGTTPPAYRLVLSAESIALAARIAVRHQFTIYAAHPDSD